MNSAILIWLTSIMLWASPPARDSARAFPGWEETATERAARYESIATDIAAVVYQPGARLPYGGKYGPARTAALLLALSFGESAWALDVDRGECYRATPATKRRCDGGRAWTIFQIQTGAATTYAQHGIEGLRGFDLTADRKVGVRVALWMVVRSFRAARLLPESERLNVYASGRVGAGGKAGAARLALAERFYRHSRPPLAESVPVVLAIVGKD